MNPRILQHLAFEPDGSLQIATYDPDRDVTNTGVVLMSTIRVPAGDQYDDEIAAVVAAVIHLIHDVLEDFPALPKLGDD